MKSIMVSTLLTGTSAARCNSRISSLWFAGMSNRASMIDHARLSYIATLAGRAKRLLPVLAAIILLAAAPRMGKADSMSFATGWGSAFPPYGCTGDCCALYELHITNTNVSEIDITLGGGTGTDACFDMTCFSTQKGFMNGVIATNASFSNPSTGVLKIVFSPALSWAMGNNLFEFLLCKTSTDTCRTYLNWITKDNMGSTVGSGHDTILTGCDSYSGPPCGGGDGAWQSGPNTICVELGASALAHCITVHFERPITAGCYPTSINNVPIYNCSCPTCKGTLSSYSADTFTWCAGGGLAGGCTFPQCTPICFTFPPGCQMLQFNHVYVTTDVANSPCDPQVAVFKSLPPGGSQTSEQDVGSQNYPNPVDASNGFNTTIPFTTSSGGIASIRIVDAKGNVVLKDNEAVTYAGKHFFYFTATDLPSGTYYYQIEFPQGVIIQNKTMLVVK